MSKVILFENKELGQVRTIRDKNNEPLFCLNDVCKILNIKKTNSVRHSINKEFDKGGVFEWHPFKTLGGIQKFIVINEPELYFCGDRNCYDYYQKIPFTKECWTY
ncbi:Bro-N domain-containing protein [Campylobacter coli]